MSLTPAQADAINQSVRFLPMTTPAGDAGPLHQTTSTGGAMPCLDIAGIQVYAYVHPDDGLRISVLFDEARYPLIRRDGDCVPCRIDIGAEHTALYDGGHLDPARPRPDHGAPEAERPCALRIHGHRPPSTSAAA